MYAAVIPARRLPLGLSSFDYQIPPDLERTLELFSLVSVPFRGAQVLGLVIEITQAPATTAKNRAIKEITAPASLFPILSAAQYAFLRDVSELYRVSIGFLIQQCLLPDIKKNQTLLKTLEKPSVSPSGSRYSLSHRYFSSPANEQEFFITHTNEVHGQLLILSPDREQAAKKYALLKDTSRPAFLVTGTLKAKEQRELWITLVQGLPCIVIGTSRALFLPWRDLAGITLVDDSNPHHTVGLSAPYADAHDLATLAADHHQITLTVTGHTPSPRSFISLNPQNRPPLTFGTACEPTFIDLAAERAFITSSPLTLLAEEAITAQTQKPLFVFLNQRGTARAIVCKDCGTIFYCPECAATLTFFREKNQLMCRACGHGQRLTACPTCRGVDLKQLGFGTEALAAHLRKQFPERSVVQIDSDTEALPKTFLATNTIIVGTEQAWSSVPWEKLGGMIWVDPDAEINVPTFRSAETVWHRARDIMFKLPPDAFWYIQTRHSTHPALSHLKHPLVWYDTELRVRQELGYPPFTTIFKLWRTVQQHPTGRLEIAGLKEELTALTQTIFSGIVCSWFSGPPRRSAHGFTEAFNLKIKASLPAIYEQVKTLASHIPPPWKVSINPENL